MEQKGTSQEIPDMRMMCHSVAGSEMYVPSTRTRERSLRAEGGRQLTASKKVDLSLYMQELDSINSLNDLANKWIPPRASQ